MMPKPCGNFLYNCNNSCGSACGKKRFCVWYKLDKYIGSSIGKNGFWPVSDCDGGSVDASCDVFDFIAALSCNEAPNWSLAVIEFNCAAPDDELWFKKFCNIIWLIFISCAKLGTFNTADVGEDADGIDIGADVDAMSFDLALIVSEVDATFSGGRPIKFVIDSDDLRLMLWFCELWIFWTYVRGGTRVICRFGSGRLCAANETGDDKLAAVGDVWAFFMVVAGGKRRTSIGSWALRRCTVKSRHFGLAACVGTGIRSLGLPNMREVFVYMHFDWNIGAGAVAGAESMLVALAEMLLTIERGGGTLSVGGFAEPSVWLPFNGPMVLLMAVTSRPPWRRMSNLRFFMFGNIGLDCDCGVGDGLLLLSLSLSTKSMISEMEEGNRSIDLLLLPRIGVIVVVFDPAK